MLLERDGNKLRAFCLYRDSDMYTLGTRISDFDEDEVTIQGTVIPSNASVWPQRN